MKRYAPVVAVLLVAIAGVFFLLALDGSSQNGSLVVVFLSQTNANATVSYAILGLTNRSSYPVAYKVDVEALGRGGWGPIRYNPRDLQHPDTSCAGWLGRGSNALVELAGPQESVRFCVSYQRVPSRMENHISWALTSLRITYPLNPRMKTLLVYPKEK